MCSQLNVNVVKTFLERLLLAGSFIMIKMVLLYCTCALKQRELQKHTVLQSIVTFINNDN